MLAFATQTWDGWDYVPQVWDAWLAAPDGVLLVACAASDATRPDGAGIAAGQPVAMSRLALLAPGEGWVEGIRVDPRVRGREVATNLQVAELAWAAAHGSHVVRYTTGQDNEASHRLGARHGFHRQADRRSYGPRRDGGSEAAPPDPAALQRLDRAAPAVEIERWWRLVADDPTFVAGDGLYEPRGWAFQTLDADRFAAHVRRGEVAQARDGRAVVVTSRGDDEATPDVALLAGDGDSALALLADLQRAAGRAPRPRLPDPDPPMLRDGVAERWAAGGFAAHEHTLHILARTMDQPLPVADPPGILVLADAPRPVARPPVL